MRTLAIRSRLVRLLIALLAFQTRLISCVTLDVNSDSSLRHASQVIIKDIFSQYTGDQPGGTPGILPGYGTPDGYYWWVGGGLFGAMIQYWASSGDSTWNDITRDAIVFQSAPAEGGYFEPKNESAQLGNDDISFWAFAAMEAAEYKFPNPTDPDSLSYLGMVQAVFNRQAGRWDGVCGGGLRWQVFIANPGYSYKNSISNGCFFQIGARLGLFTGNQTYLHWAEKTWDWMEKHQLISANYTVYDGINATDCSIQDHSETWSYNVGVLLYGAAIMWNITKQDIWRQRTAGLIESSRLFLYPYDKSDPVMTEVICEPYDQCKTDATTFKGYLIRWMYASIKVAPWTAGKINDMLQYSAAAAASVCSQPDSYNGYQCGLKWYESFDGDIGIGQNMNALTAISNLLGLPYPVNLQHSDTKSQPAGGSQVFGPVSDGAGGNVVVSVTTGDKAGAAIITILLAAWTFGGAWWLLK